MEVGRRMDDSIELGCALSRADFDAMAQMETGFYGEDLITPAEEAWHWYVAHPFTTYAARCRNGRIAGFVNLFPVHDQVYRAVLAGAFNDADLLASDVVDPFREEGTTGAARPLNMLLSCVVVAREWQDTGLAYRLLSGAAAQFAGAARPIASVAIDTATPDGARLALKLGFSPVGPTDHGTHVWQTSWQDFVACLNGH